MPLTLFAIAAASPLALVALGAWLGGIWAWAALIWMGGAVVALDLVVPMAAGNAGDGVEFPGSDLLLAALALGGMIGLPMVVAALGQQSFGPQQLAVAVAAGLWLGQAGHPCAHELIHRPTKPLFYLGNALYGVMLMGHHASAHRLVHHRHVGTKLDPNSARLGQSFWSFAPRAWVRSFRAGLAAEQARGGQAYLGHFGWAAAAIAAGYALAGWWGVVLWLGLGLHASLQILLADYVQHYGLTRQILADGKPEPVGPQHSWNSGHWATSAMMLNAPRHSDHHSHPNRPYPALRLTEDAPRLPWPLPMAAVIALIPPLWHKRMRQVLEQVQR